MTALSRVERTLRPRVVAFVDATSGLAVTDDGVLCPIMSGRTGAPSVRDVLTNVPARVERVFMVGHPRFTAADMLEAGALPAVADVVHGWQAHPDGHHFGDGAPVGRYQLGDSGRGRTMEIRHAREWFGDEPLTIADALAGWSVMLQALRREWPAVVLLGSPGNTGQDLLLRSLPRGTAYPVMPDNEAAVLRSGSGQGRTELFAGPAELPGLVQLDMRFAYAALTWGMPVGPASWDRLQEVEPHVRGRYRVHGTVPAGWPHVGLFGVQEPDSPAGWRWPAEPGEPFACWADGGEVELARRWGWHVEVAERCLFRTGRPLDTWSKRLVAARAGVIDAQRHSLAQGGFAAEAEAPGMAAASRGLRAILLHGIGAFHSAGQWSTHATRDPGDVPTGTEWWREGDLWLWRRRQSHGTWGQRFAHPEWSAAIWARCRARLLDGPGAGLKRTGMLHVPRAHVVACRTDALYLAADPGWPDDGLPGRFRVKGDPVGPCKRPTSWGSLAHAMRGPLATAGLVELTTPAVQAIRAGGPHGR